MTGEENLILQRDAIEDHAECQLKLLRLDRRAPRSDSIPPLLRFTASVLMNSEHWMRVSLIRTMGVHR